MQVVDQKPDYILPIGVALVRWVKALAIKLLCEPGVYAVRHQGATVA